MSRAGNETSPAARYAAAQRRARDSKTALATFQSSYEFALDEYQIAACECIENGQSVLVAAPTGSGKTVVGEFAIFLALEHGTRAFYTTPIKALSNQKYRDLVERYGKDNVGLLTGDTVLNGDAPVVVMTTEVLRNMLYEGSDAISELSHVVMDEVHYLADRQRGPVWEEVILHLPESVSLTALSATVSNAEEFGAWLRQVRGDTDVIVEERRPIPLHQHVLAGRRLLDLFANTGEPNESGVNPELIQLATDDARATRASRGSSGHAGRSRRGAGGKGTGAPRRQGGGYLPRSVVLERLDRYELLPAIMFVFSRRGCDESVKQCLNAGLRLTNEHERRTIREYVDERCRELPGDDLNVLGYYEWRDALERGLAAHHAGMLPLFKETVEELFSLGLTKAVFATETLALGINMPARSVVLERLVKWNGSAHADITAGEYTQLTGRAGRRGIDTEGHAVTTWHTGLDPHSLAGLASKRTYPLRSSFRPSYNMAINLITRLGAQAARELLETSFAQYQADAGVVGIARQIRKHDEALAGYRESMQCHLGDFGEYAELRAQLAARERAISKNSAADRRVAAASALANLRMGDIVVLPTGRRVGPALVVEVARPNDPEPRVGVLTLDRRVKKVSSADTPHGIESIARMKVPRNFDSRSANWRRDLSRTLGEKTAALDLKRPRKRTQASEDDAEITALRLALRAHPCHGCNDREAHARWGERYHRLERETAQLRKKVETRTNTIARQFDRVCALLENLGYLEKGPEGKLEATPAGGLLARLYSDQDLLAAECLREEIWDGLTAAELAGAAAALVYESRGADDGGATPPIPNSPALRAALADQSELAIELAERESNHHLDFTRAPNAGFSMAAFEWAKGEPLNVVLRESELAPGDFVRWCRQLIDLLGQIAEASPQPDVRRCARAAIDGLQRGVVSYTAVVDEQTYSDYSE
ncbi:MAG: ATP-dependent RNA helicase HelY [Actinomycetes bacterium]